MPPEQQHTTYDRVPPHDVSAEQSVLGGMLMSSTAIADVTETIGAEDFYQPRHGIIFEAIRALTETGHPADAVTVAAALADAGDLAKIGGGPYLHDLLDAVPTAANAGYYARVVADRAQQRRLIEVGTRIAQLGYNPGGRDLAELINLAQSTVMTATTARTATAATEFSDVLDQVVAEALDPDTSRGRSTGLGILDDLIGGLKPGQLILVAGRPGMGKTILAINFLRALCIRAALPALMVSMEMSAREILKRILAAETPINLARITNASLREYERPQLVGTAERLRGLFLWVDDTPNIDLAQIRTTARRLAAGTGLELIVVDYLQLMNTGGDGSNRAIELGNVSRGLKILARELEIPIVACCQLNRGPTTRSDRRPQLSDLRESGALEQDSDVVILLDRPDYYEPEHPRAGEVDLIVAKNRNGPVDTVNAVAQLHFARFVDPNIPTDR